MLTLQETVHKECTEREQLKDALIEARQQLLAMKKNGRNTREKKTFVVHFFLSRCTQWNSISITSFTTGRI
jgi:hypothetical protein